MTERKHPGALAGATGAMERDEQGGFITSDNRRIHHELQALRIRERFHVSPAVARVIAAHVFQSGEMR